jgi:Helix-turn-helix domain
MGQNVHKRERAALELAKGRSARAVAGLVGVAPKTLYRWQAEEAFGQRVTQLRAALYAEAVACLTGLAKRAARTLGGLLRSKSETVRLAAARAVLETGGRLRELTEIEERLGALEGAAAAGDSATAAYP